LSTPQQDKPSRDIFIESWTICLADLRKNF